MNLYQRNFSWPQHPLAQVASMLVFLAFAVIAVFVGAVLFSFLFGLAAIAAVVVYARLWWLRRKQRGAVKRPSARGRIIDAQYEVVRRRDDRQD